MAASFRDGHQELAAMGRSYGIDVSLNPRRGPG